MPLLKRKPPAKAKSAPRLQLLDASGAVLYDGALEALVLEEALVLSLSVSFFGDPEPCFIHRSAVLQRAYMELTQALEGRGPVQVSALPADISRYLSAFAQCATCHLTRTEDIA